LQQAQGKFPEGVSPPQISPISSPIGTVIKYAFTSKTTPLIEVRRIIDAQVTNRLRAVPGVTQVIVMGGDVRQYQVLIDPEKLASFDVSLADVSKAVAGANANAPGGFLTNPDRELLVRGVGRIESIEELKKSVITERNGTPILLDNVADVKIGAALKRGDTSFNGQKAIILTVEKQPATDTPTVTIAIEAAMTELQPLLPKDVKATVTFRQADYIESSLKNVEEALRDGAIIVSIILILFLMNWRTLIITLSGLPLCLLLTVMLLSWTGQGINTMTLGGLAVAIGSIVDDAIVDMENVYRRLRENQLAGTPVPPLQVVFNGSLEVRVSVLFSTVIIVVVFAPIFALSGVEGRIFTPLGIAYLLCVIASTVVALTLTPAMCALLLANHRLPQENTWIGKITQRLYHSALMFALRYPQIILMISGIALVASLLILPTLGRVFLPEFQERSLVVATNLYPGVSLDTTNRVGLAIEDALKDNKQFDAIQMRAGRAPGDTDAGGVNFGEMDLELTEAGLKDREVAIETLRTEFGKLPGVVANVGGFISDRFAEVLSGVRAGIAVKIYGDDFTQLRNLGSQVQSVMNSVEGIVDLQVEPQVPIKQVQIKFDREAASRYGLTVREFSETIATALNGRVVSQVLEQQQLFDLLVWLEPNARQDLQTIRDLLIDTPRGLKLPLATIAKIDYGIGPNTINRENVSRRILVSANVSGRDLRAVINEIQEKIKRQVQLKSGYFIEYGGQFEAEERATQSLIFFGGLAFVGITVIIYLAVKSTSATIMIMINLPLALIGGVISVAMGDGIISVASMVGFITLFGVATRNGLLLVENYNHKLATGMPLHQVLIEGSSERVTAILMTALSSAVGIAPLVIGGGAGKEILQPLSVVVLGGLFSSTALTLLVIPASYAQFSKFLVPRRLHSQKYVVLPATSQET
ncbi:MAG: efflux RND transporter permease subunit, partial [Nostocaceae cyanobacterium]|nr:efflux RND transporter permease subunit [Nostocaceae cyanobacterium]